MKLQYTIKTNLAEMREAAKHKGYAYLSDEVLERAFDCACSAFQDEQLWDEMEYQVEQILNDMKIFQGR